MGYQRLHQTRGLNKQTAKEVQRRSRPPFAARAPSAVLQALACCEFRDSGGLFCIPTLIIAWTIAIPSPIRANSEPAGRHEYGLKRSIGRRCEPKELAQAFPEAF